MGISSYCKPYNIFYLQISLLSYLLSLPFPVVSMQLFVSSSLIEFCANGFLGFFDFDIVWRPRCGPALWTQQLQLSSSLGFGSFRFGSVYWWLFLRWQHKGNSRAAAAAAAATLWFDLLLELSCTICIQLRLRSLLPQNGRRHANESLSQAPLSRSLCLLIELSNYILLLLLLLLVIKWYARALEQWEYKISIIKASERVREMERKGKRARESSPNWNSTMRAISVNLFAVRMSA